MGKIYGNHEVVEEIVKVKEMAKIDENEEIKSVINSLQKITNGISTIKKIACVFAKAGLECDETHDLFNKIRNTEMWLEESTWMVMFFSYNKISDDDEKYKFMQDAIYYLQNGILNISEIIKEVVDNYKNMVIKCDETLDDVERLEFSAWCAMQNEMDYMVDELHHVESVLDDYFHFEWEPEI